MTAPALAWPQPPAPVGAGPELSALVVAETPECRYLAMESRRQIESAMLEGTRRASVIDAGGSPHDQHHREMSTQDGGRNIFEVAADVVESLRDSRDDARTIVTDDGYCYEVSHSQRGYRA